MKFRWVKRLLIALVTVLVGLSIPVVLELHARSQARADLEKIIAELDRTDPRWRLEDIEADRQPVPTEKNSADTVIAAHRLLPKNWDSKIAGDFVSRGIYVKLQDLPPPIILRKDQADQLAAELKPLERALEIARKLKDQPSGRYKIAYSQDFLSTLVPDLGKAQEVAKLLVLDIAQLVHRQEMEKAWHSNLALLNACRSIGDEPLLISTILRLENDAITVGSLERALGQGEFQAGHLEEFQKALNDELAVPHCVIGLRGERGGTDYFLSNIENGKVSLLQTLDNIGKKNPRSHTTSWEPFNEFFAFSMVIRSHATLLDLQTRVIEALKLPPNERQKALKEVDLAFEEISPKDKSQILTRLLFSAILKLPEQEKGVHSRLACAVAGLGAERFRLKKKRWPESLEEIVQAGCLKKVPIDQFDGNPLRFRRTKDGLVIYSIGREGNDDGKALDDLRNINDAVRVEFRLWDPAQRRQPPLPAKPKDHIKAENPDDR
jgi:hypothetical protein